MEGKFFDLARANEMIPALEYRMPLLVKAKKELTEFVTSLVKKGIHVEELFSMTETRDEDLIQAKLKLEKLGMALQSELAEIQGLGLVVKDMDLGLVDFPGKIGEDEVFFCWQLGEKEIRYWHRKDEGFSARKPLNAEEEDKSNRVYH